MSFFGLPESTVMKINEVFSHYSNIDKVVVYGSRAKGNFRPGSDIDLTLFSDQFSEEDLNHLQQDLDDLNTPYLIDLSIFSKLSSPELIDHIERVGQIFYRK